jgi:hypothetical protein
MLLISDYAMNRELYKYYEVIVFGKLGDFVEHELSDHPFFTCVRTVEECPDQCCMFSRDDHDHFIVIMAIETDDPDEPTKLVELHRLLKLRFFYENLRPPKSKFVSWEKFRGETTSTFHPYPFPISPQYKRLSRLESHEIGCFFEQQQPNPTHFMQSFHLRTEYGLFHALHGALKR